MEARFSVVRIWMRMKHRKFLIRLMTSIILLAVFPNLLLGTIAYFNVMTTFEEETGTSSTRYLNQSMNALELVIKQITASCQQLVLNPSFRNFESYPNGLYYESINGVYPEQDLPSLYWYIKNKTSAIESIQYFKLSNEFVDSVYYYDSSKNLVLAINGENTIRQYSYGEFFDRDWHQAWSGSHESPALIDPRMAMQYNGQRKEILTLLFRANQTGNLFIINLDAALIYNKIINELNHRGSLFVLSGAGAVLFRQELSPEQQETADRLERIPITDRVGYLRAEMDGDQQLVTYAKSDRLQWTFINVNSMDKLLDSIKYLRRVIVYSILLLLVLTIGFSLLASKKLYRPIARIVSLLAGKIGKSGDVWTDEIHRIDHALRTTFDERDLYLGKLEESLPYYREQLKNELLRLPAIPNEALREKLSELSIPIGLEQLALLLLTFEEHSAMHHASMDVPWSKVRLLEQLKQGGLLHRPYMTVDTGQRQLAIVLHAEAAEMNDVFKVGAQMIEQMEKLAEVSVSIGIGRHCASIAELPRAYEEASEALRFRLLHGRGQVIYIEDVIIGQEDVTGSLFPKKHEELFAGYIKLGEAAQAKRMIHDLIVACSAQKNKMHYAQLQFLFFKIITIVLQTLQHIGADITRLVSVDNNPFRKWMALETAEQIQSWFDVFLQNAADCVGAGKRHKENHHVSHIVSILEKDHAKDLSLNLVSEQLNLNPSYVSRLFKQYTGTSFTQYLTDIRIRSSKELLRTTELQVGEVGSRVGFYSSYYFIKVFRENAGVTPGEYKKIFGGNDEPLNNDDIANL